EALESARRVGVVHGDLRPDDMRLTPAGEPVLADFGVVTLVRPNAAPVTDPADLAHVAPQLLDGTPATAASDVYSLASALYTLFTGLPAFGGPGRGRRGRGGGGVAGRDGRWREERQAAHDGHRRRGRGDRARGVLPDTGQ